MKTVTAAQASRRFPAVLRAVAQGERVTVTSRGRPVATIEPIRARTSVVRAGAAKRRLLARLAGQPAAGVCDGSPDPLYD
ncbi:MAG TPA: type II toxin-antitoxin system prevent-host-death family antitoxin [Rubrivivax sp.]|nr:type II toxin-antitoxin system prevent-host-death family antitoxin [Rubrivivax sp.]